MGRSTSRISSTNSSKRPTYNPDGLVWGHRSYCEEDAGYPFGSSIDNHNFAAISFFEMANTATKPTLSALKGEGWAIEKNL